MYLECSIPDNNKIQRITFPQINSNHKDRELNKFVAFNIVLVLMSLSDYWRLGTVLVLN